MIPPDVPAAAAVPAAVPHRVSDGAGGRTVSLAVIAVAAGVALLYAGRDVFIPLALGATLAAVMRPAVAWLTARLRVPPAAGAAVMLLALLGGLAAGGNALQEPAQVWIADAPKALARARQRFDELRRPVQRVTRAVERATAGGAGGGAGGGSGEGLPVPSAMGSVVQRAFGTTAGLLASTAEVLLLAYFLLAGDDRYLRRLVGGIRTPGDKRTVVEVVRESEAHVGRYLGTTALINVGQGVVVGLALWALGLPAPVLWGVATALCEFLPYLGAVVMVGALAVAGLATFPHVGQALAAPGVYLLVSTLQNNLVSPLAYGRALKLNPFAILVAVLAGYALWGVAGVFLAVPAAAAANVLADHVPALAPLGAFLRE